MSDASIANVKGGFEAVLPTSFVEAQERQAAAMMRVHELMASAAKAIWESQADLLQAETQSAAQSLTAFKTGGDPAERMAATYKAWRENSENVIARTRALNDVTWDYSWRLMELYAGNLRPESKR